MHHTVIKGNGFKQKGWHKLKFGNLAAEDLKYEDRKKDELIERLQKKPGKSKEEIDKLMADL